MEDNLLVMIAGVLLSLAFAYVPGLRDKFDGLESERKALAMAAVLLVAALGVFVAGCYSPWQAVECSEEGAWALVDLFIAAIIANQATFLIGVKPFKA